MLQVVSIVLDAAEGYAAKSVDLEDKLGPRGRSYNVDIGLFANANAIARAVESTSFEVGVEREVVKAAIGKAVPVIYVARSASGVGSVREGRGGYIWHSSFGR